MQALGEEMRRRGVSQAALADAVGVTQQAVSAWLTGRARPSIEVIRRVDDFLGADGSLVERHAAESTDKPPAGWVMNRGRAFEEQCRMLVQGAGFSDLRPAPRTADLPTFSDFEGRSASGRWFAFDCRLQFRYDRLLAGLAPALLVDALGIDHPDVVLLIDRTPTVRMWRVVEELADKKEWFHVVALDDLNGSATLRELARS